MRNLIVLAAGAALASSVALAEPTTMTSVPNNAVTVTDWYKQDVYDPNNNKIGSVSDVLVSPEGQVKALVVGVGGFLGVGQKDVVVSFGAIKQTKKDNKIYLTTNATKDELKAAPGFKYDREKTAWVPDTGSSMAKPDSSMAKPNR
jgi:sporulation protein YlmC with PRC-barrel domain